MLKFVGGLVLVGAVAFGAAFAFGLVDFGASASLTDKGQAQVQDTRNTLADQVRGTDSASQVQP